MFWFSSPIPRLLRAADSKGLADLLRRKPALEADFVQRAQAAIQANNFVEAVVLALALARRDAASAQQLLGHLLGLREWRKVHAALDDEELVCLLLYLIQRRSPLANALFQACSPEQTAHVERVLQTAHAAVWFDLLWQRADGAGAEVLDRLRRQPSLQQWFLDRTLADLEQGRSGDALRVLAVLRGCDSPHALTLLTRLLNVAGSLLALDSDGALDLVGFVRAHPELLLPLLRGLSPEAFAGLAGKLSPDEQEAWAYLALEREELYVAAADRLAGLTRVAPADDIPLHADAAVLGHALDAALATLAEELRKPTLTGTGEQALRRTWLLTRLCQRRIGLDLAKLLAGCLEKVSIAGLWAGAGLLGQVPRREWVAPLRAAWFRLEAISRSREKHVRTRSTDVPLAVLELAAFEVAGAIGAAAAEDANYRDLAADEHRAALMDAVEKERRERVLEYNRVAQELRQVASGSGDLQGRLDGLWSPVTGRSRRRPVFDESVPVHERQGPLVEELRELRRDIDRLEREVDEKYRQVRDALSPGTLLRNLLGNSQAHGIGIRQAAAWGLYRLLRDGHLDGPTARRLRESLCGVLGEDRAFRERRVHLPAGCGRAEMLFCLEDGLGWHKVMEQLRQAAPDDEVALKPPDSAVELARLTTLCDLAHRHLPGAVTFFERHPLRLMNRADHQALLGQYVSSGADVERWLYYTPPENVGKVQSRYLLLEDRSTPNSLGIDAGLFRHELLVLPVLYHEFLHHGGIANEMEVRFREMLFHRALVARLAPTDDASLPEYEANLVAAAQAADCICVLVDLLHDYGDDSELGQVNEAIADTYGRPLTEEAAREVASARLHEYNVLTYFINLQQTWDPEITWPLLEAGDELTHLYADILVRRRMQEHTLSPERRDRILAEPASREAVAAWAAYCKRAGATETLRPEAERLRAEMELAALYRLLVRRFPYLLRGEVQPSEVQPSEQEATDATAG